MTGTLAKALSKHLRFVHGLRFRLTLSYLVFFSLLLAGVGILFRTTLKSIQQNQVGETLEEEWGAIKGYLKFEDKRGWYWFYDSADPEESFVVERLRRVYLLADAEYHILEGSPTYRSLGPEAESPELIRRELDEAHKTQAPLLKIRKSDQGVSYLIRSGPMLDDRHREYYLAIGRSLTDSEHVLQRFTRTYFILLPFVIAFSTVLGWLMAGPALRPVTEVAQTAQRVTSSNLGVQIPLRNSGDELDHLIETFNKMSERLKSSFDQTRQFSTDVSHELRTPLTAIRGQLEVSLFTAKTPEQFRDAIENALQDVERLSNLVRALLMLSQAESGQLPLNNTVIDLAGLVQEIVDMFQIPAEAEEVHLFAHVPQRCSIVGDRVQLERLLSNLLSNAIKYTPAGGHIHVRLSEADGWVTLEVADTGLGIPADHLPHIFDRFYRVPDPNPEKGLGLGLSFVALIVKAHAGEINVDSTVGKGTRFLVSLPVGDAYTQDEVRQLSLSASTVPPL